MKKGMTGVVICVIAIMGTVVLGYATTVYETSETVTEYTYITDITGLFETSRDASYIEYNPSGNWTGYYVEGSEYTSGIAYTTSTVANKYVVHIEPDETVYGDVDASLGLKEFVDGSVAVYVNPTYLGTNTWYGQNYSVKSLLDTLATDDGVLSSSATAATVTIAGFDTASPENDSTKAPRAVLSSAIGTALFNVHNTGWSSVDSSISYMVVNVAEGSVTAYNSSGQRILYGADWNEVVILADGQNANGESTGNNTLTVTWTPTTAAEYMNIQDGLTLTSGDVTWENGYVNSSISILMVRPDKSSTFETSWTFDLGSIAYDEDATSEANRWPFTLSGQTVTITARSEVGQTSIYVYEGSTLVGAYDLTSWSRWIVSYDALNGVVELTPLVKYDSMTSYSEYATYTIATLTSTGVFETASVTW